MLPRCVSRCVSTGALLRFAAMPSTSQSVRNTWVFRRVFAPDPTPEGGIQRDPRELHITQKVEILEEDAETTPPPIKVILLQDVEGVGHQFDIVDVEAEICRNDLLLTRKAVYASPFDLQYYSVMKEKMKDELAARVRIPFEYVKVGRLLQKIVVPIRVSMEKPWTLDRGIVKASLREVGVDLLDDAIFIPDGIKGPNFEIEAKLIRFYIVVSKQYIVPMLGRLAHISTDDMKQMLSVETSKLPDEKALAKHGLRPETPYFHQTSDIDDSFDVIATMKTHALEQN